MNDSNNDFEINKDALALIRFRILKKERDNEKTNARTPAQMVDVIRKIIEEEVDAHDN